jgi:Na+(H+)/acetate symporter ActP
VYSRDHFLLSIAVGAIAALVAGVDPVTGLAWVAVAAAVGVGIDFDHFLVAWYKTGETRAIRYCLCNPRAVVLDQDSIFAADDLGKLDRLLSHLLIAGPLAAALWLFDPATALLVAATLYVHVVADLVHDIRESDGADDSLQ